ncbi:hypothetical protein FFA01_20470 [Frigoribacterium faeni]|uniref:Uncharacterized protein n=1 Tax=Frigoribacterium faeni TaxID=145483 RepID=A0ABQ0UQH5_9MICO|nr:hypothetical protein FFA01_20470 [Frigoribacterium faeni]
MHTGHEAPAHDADAQRLDRHRASRGRFGHPDRRDLPQVGHFTAPDDSPVIKCFCTSMKPMSTGSETTTEAAISWFQ